MAYAYPSDPPVGSTSTLGLQGTGAGGGGRTAGGDTRGGSQVPSRQASDDKFDVVLQFKSKIDEDDAYLSFFQERVRLEEDYIAGLNKIYSRAKAVDTIHDEAYRKQAKPTTRAAWAEVRDYTQREIQSREAMVGALKDTVVRDLMKLRDEQSRIRQGLKDSMRKANDMYDDYSKNTLSKLKRTYWQKCQAVEDHKRQENAIVMQAKLLADSPTSPAGTPLREHPNAFTVPPPSTAAVMSPPISTGPLPPSSNPAQASDLSVSFSSPTTENPPELKERKLGRLRAGSGSGVGDLQKPKDVFVDLANQGKKGFKAMMEKLGGEREHRERDDSGFVVVPPGGEEPARAGLVRRGSGARGDPTRGMGTMRGVKVKRDADEADKAYRQGVFHLESLRLQRDKLHTSGVRNLETFNDDLNRRLLSALEAYVDTMHGTAATNAQSTEVARQAIGEVNLDSDTSLFRKRLRAAEVQRTASIPYHNYYVGECRSLIFGFSLTDYDFARGDSSDKGRPPIIVEKCLAAIDEKGLESEGIYRISGRHAGVQKIIQDIELDENKFAFDPKDDVFSISNVLKQYLRELPEPVFHVPQPERVKYTQDREALIAGNFSPLRSKLRRLAPIHQTTFRAIIEHLSRIAAHSAQNKMDGKNLQVVFNSVIFGQDQLPIDGNVMTMHLEKDTLLEDIINHSALLFGAEGPNTSTTGSPSDVTASQPDAGDGAKPGSSRTRIQIVAPGESAEHAPKPQASPTIIKTTPTPMFESADPGMPAPTFTPDEQLELMFDPAVIPESMRDALGDAYHVRPLASTDLMRSHFDLLATLTVAPPIAPSVYANLFTHLKSCNGTYYILVVIDKSNDQMIAHGAVILEQKYIHGGASAGHIEDIVVDPDVRGGGVGKKLVVGLRDLAIGLGAYKVNLGCKEDRIPFYEKCGFHQRGRQMSYYRSNTDTTPLVSPAPSAHAALPPNTAPAHPDTLTVPGISGSSRPHGVASEEHAAELEEQRSGNGSPKTFTTVSSENGVTYHYPTQPSAEDSAEHPEDLSEEKGNKED